MKTPTTALFALLLTGCATLQPPSPPANLFKAEPPPIRDHSATPHEAFIQIDAGRDHRCALRKNGEVLCWGSNTFGEAGQWQGNELGQPIHVVWSPKPVQGVQGAVQIALASEHSCALMVSGEVLCWGQMQHPRMDPVFNGGAWVTRGLNRIKGFGGVQKLVSGNTHLCALDFQGAVVCWGSNRYGQRAQPGVAYQTLDNAGRQKRQTPSSASKVEGLPPAVDLVAARHGACALSAEGRVFCWGDVKDQDPTSLPWQPIRVERASMIGAGGDHACAVMEGDNLLRCWSLRDRRYTRDHPLPEGRKIVAFHASDALMCALDDLGDAHCLATGRNGSGWGDPKAWHHTEKSIALSPSRHSHCTLSEDHKIHCWGSNHKGQLGIGTKTTRKRRPGQASTPVVHLADTYQNGQLRVLFSKTDNPTVHTQTTWSMDGAELSSGPVLDDIKHGQWRFRHGSTRESRGAFFDGQPDGVWFLAEEARQKTRLIAEYKRGEQILWRFESPQMTVSLQRGADGLYARKIRVQRQGLADLILEDSHAATPHFPPKWRPESAPQLTVPRPLGPNSSQSFLHPIARNTLHELVPKTCRGPVLIKASGGAVLYEGDCGANGLEGVVKQFSEAGRLLSEITYEQGRREGPAVFRSTQGRVWMRGQFKDGLRSGSWRATLPSGRPFHTGAYQSGHPVGVHRSWHPNGKPRSVLRFYTKADIDRCHKAVRQEVGPKYLGASKQTLGVGGQRCDDLWGMLKSPGTFYSLKGRPILRHERTSGSLSLGGAHPSLPIHRPNSPDFSGEISISSPSASDDAINKAFGAAVRQHFRAPTRRFLICLTKNIRLERPEWSGLSAMDFRGRVDETGAVLLERESSTIPDEILALCNLKTLRTRVSELPEYTRLHLQFRWWL